MDLSKLKCNDTAEIEIVHPVTGDKLGMYVTVAGRDSETFRAARRELVESRIQSMSKATTKTVDLERDEADELNVLVASTVGWRCIEENGAPVEFNSANVRRIFATYPFIKEQVDKAIGDRALFFVS